VFGIVTGSTWGRGWLVFVVGNDRSPRPRPSEAKRTGFTLAESCRGVRGARDFVAFHLGTPPRRHSRRFAMSLDAVHVVAAGGWGGSILMLALVALPRATTLPENERANVLRELLRTFSPIALSCAAVLLITGTAEAWLQLRKPPSLVETPNTARRCSGSSSSSRSSRGSERGHWRFAQPALRSERSVTALRWSIALDVVFLLGVLVLTAILTGTAPACERTLTVDGSAQYTPPSTERRSR
jgi:hypothetical protein